MKKMSTNVGVAGTALVAASIVGVLGSQHHTQSPQVGTPTDVSSGSAQAAIAPSGGNPVTVDEVTKFLPFQVGPAADVGGVPTANNPTSTVVTIQNTTVDAVAGRLGDVAVARPIDARDAAAQSPEVTPPAVLLNSSTTAKEATAGNNPEQSRAIDPNAPVTINLPTATINVGSAVINVASDIKLNYQGQTILSGSK